MQRVRTAVIPAAGLGTRFLPATKATPKEMLPIVDIPTIQLIVEEAVRAGIENIVVITGRNKSSIEDHFDHAFELERTLRDRGKTELAEPLEALANMARIISVRQKQPLGLGHAVLCARDVVGDEPFAVMLGDDLIDNDEEPGIAQLIAAHEQTGCAAISVLEVPEGQEHLYGVVAGEDDGHGRIRVRDLVEKPPPGTAPSRHAIIGRYVLPPRIWGLLEATRPGVGGEIQLTDALRGLAHDPGLLGVPVRGERHDAGERLGYLRANLAYALKRDDLREPLRAVMRELLDRAT
ncbi:MAG TPA: UTP--glucose-1-phosphate uridylyltransferase GalU [Kofleriaceae bacterium]|nr:UTP--glucose-1-phosphate uridylyltransferase GalU [Kofleriaceae bacterium]